MQRVKMMKKYADLIIRNGLVNPAKHDIAIIANVDMHVFVGYFVAELYKMHVKSVRVLYIDPGFERLYLMNTPDTKVGQIPEHITAFYHEIMQNKSSVVFFEGISPALLRKFPIEKKFIYDLGMEKSRQEYYEVYKEGLLPSIRVCVPTREWAEAIYPNLTPTQAEDRIWQDVYERSGIWHERLNSEHRYRERLITLSQMVEKLGRYNLSKIVVTDANGTNLNIGLPVKHVWNSPLGTSIMNNGEYYIRTIPGFYLYTAPHSHNVRGVVKSSIPFFYNGELIEGAELTLENGRITKALAQKGQQALLDAINVDDFANRLGGITLVDRTYMPEAQEIKFFDNVLLDLAECTHLTIGHSTYKSYQNGAKLSSKELQSHGLNQSQLRLDFPIASDSMKVIGEDLRGHQYLLMENGKFVF